MAAAQVAGELCASGSSPFVATTPDVIKANVTIFHSQLRDLLQPAWEKGKVLFIHQMAVEYVDFNDMTMRPAQVCSLNFAAVCLTTGSGLMAAGGEHSELDIRPAYPRPMLVPNPVRAHRLAGVTFMPDPRSEFINLPRWHLRTPTGGSINNSICIQPEQKLGKASMLRSIVTADEAGFKADVKSTGDVMTLVNGSQNTRHRGKRRKEEREDYSAADRCESNVWRRDDPWGRPGEPQSFDSDAAKTSDRTLAAPSHPKLQEPNKLTFLRILISNNDKSVKAFRLRPPTRARGEASTSSSSSNTQSESIEYGLPGLSRTQTVQFPTCINHTSFSPDGKHVVSVGDTPEVFLYSVHPTTGELQKITSYTAGSDAAFSTTWSPDSLQFAVASQDGNVSVWDVRSSEKVANLQTLQIADLYGAGAARVVKWSPCGRILAFSEQQNYVHLVDTTTFEVVQQLRIPSVHGGAASISTAVNRSASTAADATNSVYAEADIEATSSDDDPLDDLVDRVRVSGRTLSARQYFSEQDSSSTDIVAGSNADEWISSTSPDQLANTSRTTSASRNLAPRRWLSGQRFRDIGGYGESSGATSLSDRVNAMDRVLLGEWSGEPLAQSELSNNATNSGNGSGRPSTSRLSPTGYRLRTYAEAVGPRLSSSTIGASSESTVSLDPTARALEAANAVTASNRPSTNTTALQPHRQSGLWSFGHVMNRLRRNGHDHDSIEISGLTWDPDGEYLYVSTTHAIFRYTVLDTRSSMAQATLR